MLSRAFAAIAAHRRLFLLGVVLLAAILGVLGTFVVSLALVLVFLGLYATATAHHHPAVLFVRAPNAFTTAVNPAPSLIAATFIIMGGSLLGEDIRDIAAGEDLWQFDAVTSVLWVLVIALHLFLNWGRVGVRLTPEGLHDRQAFGSLFVPWEALNPDQPVVPEKNNRLGLFYQRPDLVRRRGLRAGGDTIASATDATFLAGAIGLYVANPDARPLIGTDPELRRLTGYLVATHG